MGRLRGVHKQVTVEFHVGGWDWMEVLDDGERSL